MFRAVKVFAITVLMSFVMSGSVFRGFAQCADTEFNLLANCVAAGYTKFKVVVYNASNTDLVDRYIEFSKEALPEKDFETEIYFSCNDYSYLSRQITVDGKVIIVFNAKTTKCVPH